MAKLNGVVLTAEAIEYNGEKYEKIEDKAQVGDIVRHDADGFEWAPRGTFYEIVENPQKNARIIDEEGDYVDVSDDDDYSVFRKVTEPVTESPQQYREVKREANVGERIKIVAATMNFGYGNGDEGIVTGTSEAGVFVDINRGNHGIYTREYVVLEPITQPSDDLIVVDGVTYSKLNDAKPQEGGYIMATDDKRDVTRGKVYEVEDIDGDGDPHFTDDGGDINWTRRYVVVERVADQPQTTEQLTAEVEEAKRKLAEAEKQLAEKQAEEAKAKDPRNAFAAGDKVRLISGGGIAPLYGYHNGEVYTVSNRMYPTGSIEITGGGQRTAYAKPEQLEKVSEEDIAEANRLKVGEYAKVVNPKILREDKRGHIVEVLKDERDQQPYNARSLTNSKTNWYYEEELVRATDEEVAEAKRKLAQAEEAAQWAKIGRKVGEFKDGDVVLFTEDTGADEYPEGSIAVIRGVDGNDFYFGDSTFAGDTSWCKLIAPVESIVNLTVN